MNLWLDSVAAVALVMPNFLSTLTTNPGWNTGDYICTFAQVSHSALVKCE